MRNNKLRFSAIALALVPSLGFAADLQWGAAGEGGNGTWDNGSTANWFNGAATPWVPGNTAVFDGTAGIVTISGTIPGVQGLRFDVSGYQVNAGAVTLTSPEVDVGGGGTTTIASVLDGTGGLTLSGGTLALTSGANALTGPYTINAGARMINVNGTFSTNGNDVAVNGILDYNSVSAGSGRFINSLTGSGLITCDALAAPGVANIRLHEGNFAGNIQDASTVGRTNALVMQNPAGMVRLSGNNRYSGQTLIRGGGTLRLESAGALSPNSWLRFEDAAAANFQMAELAYGNIAATNATVAGGVSFANAHAGFAAIGADRVVTITNPAVEMVFGASHFNVKSLTFGSTNSTHKVTWTGPFSLGSPTSGANRTITVFDGPPVIDAEISAAISGGGNGYLYKDGLGTLLLSATDHTYAGETRIAAGTLALANDQAASTGPIRFHLSGSRLRSADMSTRTLANEIVLALGEAIFGSSDSGNIIVNGNVETGAQGKVITISNAVTTFAGGISGDSASTNAKSGPGKLVIASTPLSTKPLLIAEGTLALNAGVGLLNSNIIVGPNGTFDVSAVGGYTLSSLGLPQTLGGSGLVVGDVTSISTSLLAPGAEMGTLTFANTLSLDGTTIQYELTNEVTEALNDFVQVNGNLNLTGMNTISVVPVAGNLGNGTYKLLRYNGLLSGGLGNLTLAGFGGGTTRQFADLNLATPHEIRLVVSGAPANLTWKGDAVSNPGAWDLLITTNWLRGGVADAYFNYDNVTFDDTAAMFTVNLASALSPSTVTVDTAGSYLFAGAGNLSGVASLTKNGPGTLILGNFGNNDNSGMTTINAGTLVVGNNDGSGSIGAGDILNNGILNFRNFFLVTLPGAISGIGAIIDDAQGEVVLHGNNTFTGLVRVGPNAQISLRTGVIPASTAASLGASTNVTVLSDGALYVGVGGTYPQPLWLRGDGVAAETSGALRTAGTVNWTGPVVIESDTTIGTESGTLTLANTLTGPFHLTKTGAGRMVLAANNNYNRTVISGGVLQMGTNGVNGTLGQSADPIFNDGTLEISRSDTFTMNNEIIGTGGVTQNGDGTLFLNASNSFTGQFTLTKGVLAMGNDYAAGSGILRFNTAGATIRSADMTPRTIRNSVDFATSAVFGTAGSGNLIFTGPVNTGNAAKDFTVNNGTTTFEGVIAGGPSASQNRKLGPGTLVFNAVNSYTKPTTVVAGTLLVNGQTGTNVTVTGGTLGGTGVIAGPVNVQAAGTLSPGPGIGTLTINEALTLTGTLAIDIGTGGESDLIQGPTSVSLNGTLSINNMAGPLTTSHSWKIFNATGIGGAFTNVVPAQPGSGLSWDLSTITTDGMLRIATGPVINPGISATVVDGNTLKLTWPSAGWVLQGQTNVLATGLSDNWVDISESSTTNTVYLTIDPANGSAFYRLISE